MPQSNGQNVYYSFLIQAERGLDDSEATEPGANPVASGGQRQGAIHGHVRDDRKEFLATDLPPSILILRNPSLRKCSLSFWRIPADM
jgi:hypothetical protein